jgi:hypothetical protein
MFQGLDPATGEVRCAPLWRADPRSKLAPGPLLEALKQRATDQGVRDLEQLASSKALKGDVCAVEAACRAGGSRRVLSDADIDLLATTAWTSLRPAASTARSRQRHRTTAGGLTSGRTAALTRLQPVAQTDVVGAGMSASDRTGYGLAGCLVAGWTHGVPPRARCPWAAWARHALTRFKSGGRDGGGAPPASRHPCRAASSPPAPGGRLPPWHLSRSPRSPSARPGAAWVWRSPSATTRWCAGWPGCAFPA